MEKIIIIALLVFAIYSTMQKGHIFEPLGNWIKRVAGKYWCKPLACCVVCMSFWYGSAIYWIIYHQDARDWAISVVGAMGLNYVLSSLFPKEEIKIKP